ncbi:MAG: hypothetical protein FJ102_12285 [Deltaproteobacteria bacterium]|nr:hypothetical protein [Deltaproteobacteria bacterium]
MLSLLVSLASANEISAGYVFPGAAAADRGSMSVGASGGMLATSTEGVSVVTLDAALAPTDRLGLRASFLGAGEGNPLAGVSGATLGARYLVVDKEKFRFAPFGAVAVGSVAGGDTLGGFAAGVALEAGGERVWFDCAVPVVAGLLTPDGYGDDTVTVVGFPLTAAGSELGVNWRMGEHHRLRAGVVSVAPVLSYRYEATHWYAGATAGGIALPEAPGGLSVEAGARF